MKKFSSNLLRLHTRPTTPPPPPSYESHALDDAQVAEAQASPQERTFANAHGIPRPPEKVTKENLLTYLEDHELPEPPPEPYSPGANSPAGEPSPGYAPAIYSMEGHSMADPSIFGQSVSAQYPAAPSTYAPSTYAPSTHAPSTYAPSISDHSIAGHPRVGHATAAIPGYSAAPGHRLSIQAGHSSRHVPSEATSSRQTLDGQPSVEAVAERSGTTKYSFSPIGTNAMGLLPSAGAQRSQPKYYISVSLNCFMPSSHITTVYRGTDENAPRVCDFEMGIISAANSRLRMDGYNPDPISKLLMRVPRQNARWVWKLPNDTSCILLWDCSRVPFTCTAELARQAPSQLVARFTSHIQSLPSDPRQPAPELSMLEVLPAGRRCFDDILISILIVERIRLTPNPKSPFNY